MADVADARVKLKDLRELMVKARDDLTKVAADLPDDLGEELKGALQKLIADASAGVHKVVMNVSELEEGLAAL